MTRLIRVFPRKTKATPDDGLARFGPPDLFDEADEVHVSVTFTYDKPAAERLAEQWRHVGEADSLGQEMADVDLWVNACLEFTVDLDEVVVVDDRLAAAAIGLDDANLLGLADRPVGEFRGRTKFEAQPVFLHGQRLPEIAQQQSEKDRAGRGIQYGAFTRALARETAGQVAGKADDPTEKYILFRYNVRFVIPIAEFCKFIKNVVAFHHGEPYWSEVDWEVITLGRTYA